jgi:carbonic anhydrase
MQKVFHFDAPREKYRCDAAIVWCFDNRFEVGFRKYLKRIGVLNMDPIKIAGGAKCLASPEHESDREFLLDQLRKSIRLHGTERVILMVHSDCGAYGGLVARFRGDAQAESALLETELARADEVVRRHLPGIRVETYYVDFEGVWRPSAAASGALA